MHLLGIWVEMKRAEDVSLSIFHSECGPRNIVVVGMPILDGLYVLFQLAEKSV